MPKTAKVVSLNVKPVQALLLCFETGGVLGESFAVLGAKVSAFDFAGLYKLFRAANRNKPFEFGTLSFDSDGIDSFVSGAGLQPPRNFVLCALRAETMKAALNKACSMRANAVFSKYQNASDLIDAARKNLLSKRDALVALVGNSQTQTDLLEAAYTADGRTGAVRTTGSTIVPDKINTSTATTVGPDPADPQKKVTETTTTTGSIVTQTVTNTDYAYRVPHLENQARNTRAQMSLGDEQLANFTQSLALPNIQTILQNELAAIDADVNQLQIAYLNTILLSPIDGTVTGIYKNPGEAVRPGEPVVRVETDAEVYLVAKIVCRGPISIGSRLQVETTLFESPSSSLNLQAPVVAVRGEREDDQWEVIARCSNLDTTGNPIFPRGYHFDYDNTTVNVFGANET